MTTVTTYILNGSLFSAQMFANVCFMASPAKKKIYQRRIVSRESEKKKKNSEGDFRKHRVCIYIRLLVVAMFKHSKSLKSTTSIVESKKRQIT